MQRKIIVSSLLIIFTITALSIAGTNPAGPNMLDKENISKPTENLKINSEAKIDLLSTDYKLWVNAHMTGDRDESIRLEKSIFGKIALDLSACELEVRDLAKDALMSDSKVKSNKADKSNGDFEFALKLLNTKESIFRTLTNSNGYSSKYRLLGDYIEVLRRELEMPRLKLAYISEADKKMLK